MGKTVRLKENVGKHRLRSTSEGVEYLEPGDICKVGEDIPERVVEAFPDKFEEVTEVEGRVVRSDDADSLYTREDLEEMKKPVLIHIAGKEFGLSEDDIGTEHSESGTPVKDDYIDAILQRQ